MAADATNDVLPTIEQTGFSTAWDWKGSYVSKLADDGLERFSQYSATPDTTMLFAGSARFTGLSGGASDLVPVGTADGIQFNMGASVARLFEIGSNRSFFTRGKSVGQMSMSRFLADQANILRVLTKVSYKPNMATAGLSAPGSETPNPDIQMNLDAETFAVPFGLLMVFKTRGGGATDPSYGKPLTGLYVEYCMFQNYGFGIASAQPVIQESVSLEFDRVVPVSFA